MEQQLLSSLSLVAQEFAYEPIASFNFDSDCISFPNEREVQIFFFLFLRGNGRGNIYKFNFCFLCVRVV